MAGRLVFQEGIRRTTTVKLDGRVIGHIYAKSGGGFVYAPKGSTLRGATMPTVEAVKQSLRGGSALEAA
jgi:hypothetical protein